MAEEENELSLGTCWEGRRGWTEVEEGLSLLGKQPVSLGLDHSGVCPRGGLQFGIAGPGLEEALETDFILLAKRSPGRC
jgi:hypothetical protein